MNSSEKGIGRPGLCILTLTFKKVSEWCMSCKIMGILERVTLSKEEEKTRNFSLKVHTDIQGSYSSPHRSHALGEGSLHRVLLRTYGKTMFVIIWTFFLSSL